MSHWKDKVVLVTGGSRGIGKACVEAFAHRGARVCFTYVSNQAQAEAVVAKLSAQGLSVSAHPCDVADSKAGGATIEAVLEKHQRLDVLVNNAGIAIDGLVMRFKDEDWDKVLDTNLKGAFSLIRAASRPMMKQRGGAIINITSVVGEMGNAGQSAYAASKAGLIGLTKSLARELASRNIRVNAVSPGFIETDMTSGLPEETRAKMSEAIALGRLGRVEDVASAVVFLASDEASYITGEVLKVNGGLYM